MKHTTSQLGVYTKQVEAIIRRLPNSIFTLQAFPGAGKTTVTAGVAVLLCLLKPGFAITVMAGQHAALDAFNKAFTRRLLDAVDQINKELGEGTVKFPLVLRAHSNMHTEMMELVRIVESKRNFDPNPNSPNSLTGLLFQLLEVGSHRLPKDSKLELFELAESIKKDEGIAFHKLREFVAGNMTWDQATEYKQKQVATEGEPIKKEAQSPGDESDDNDDEVIGPNSGKKHQKQPEKEEPTAKQALKQIVINALLLVDVAIGTTNAFTTKTFKPFVDRADPSTSNISDNPYCLRRT